MRRGRLTAGLTVLALSGALVAGCATSEEERVAPYPVELPDPPPDVEQPDVPMLRTQMSNLSLSASQAGDTWTSSPHLFDVTDDGHEAVFDYYDDQLTGQDWDPVEDLTDINGAPAVSWERHDQRITIVVVTAAERDVAVVLTTSDQWTAP